MLSYNQIKEKKIIDLNGTPYLVLSSNVSRKQKQKAVNQTTLRNLNTGGVEERAFHQSDTVAEADIEKHEMSYIYSRNHEHWFHPAGAPKDRFPLSDAVVGDAIRFLTERMTITAVIFNPDDKERWFEHIVDIELPPKVDLLVTEAPPNIKGNTAQGGTKRATLETGIEVDVPMFIEAGEKVRINTQTKQYVERTK